jgi:peptidase E
MELAKRGHFGVGSAASCSFFAHYSSNFFIEGQKEKIIFVPQAEKTLSVWKEDAFANLFQPSAILWDPG